MVFYTIISMTVSNFQLIARNQKHNKKCIRNSHRETSGPIGCAHEIINSELGPIAVVRKKYIYMFLNLRSRSIKSTSLFQLFSLIDMYSKRTASLVAPDEILPIRKRNTHNKLSCVNSEDYLSLTKGGFNISYNDSLSFSGLTPKLHTRINNNLHRGVCLQPPLCHSSAYVNAAGVNLCYFRKQNRNKIKQQHFEPFWTKSKKILV